jgi:peptide/nickel transport system permease protein
MGTYIARRLIQSALILFGLSIVFFVILHLTPGGPCAAFEGAGVAAQAKREACIQRLGLDKPVVVQYLNSMGTYLHGDFGNSSSTGDPVTAIILAKLPATILLIGSSYLLQQIIALPLGIFAALRQYSFFDQAFTFLSYVGLSMPTFWLGLLLIFFFAWHWTILPPGRVEDVSLPVFWSHDWFVMLGQNPGLILGDLVRHLIMPMMTLCIVGIAADSRFMLASMLEVINMDYIRTAKAKGLSRKTVIFKHAFRNAVLPIITNVALFLPTLVGGAVITETIFTWGGIGYLFITAIGDNDFPIVQALLMIGALAVLLANLLADLTYAWVDPRIRYD